MDYEIKHLLRKLKVRDPQKLRQLKTVISFEQHLMFRIVKGEIESREVV